MSKYTAVWIDHKEAKIFHVDPEGFDESTVRAPAHHVTRKGEAHGHEGNEHFYHAVAKALEGSEIILVVGPSSAKLEFIRHVHKHDHVLQPKIIGVETLDHPTDRQLVAYVRHYFRDEAHVHPVVGS